MDRFSLKTTENYSDYHRPLTTCANNLNWLSLLDKKRDARYTDCDKRRKNSILLEYTIELINFYSPVKFKINERKIDLLLFPSFS